MFIGNHYIESDNEIIPQVGSDWGENALPDDIARDLIQQGLLNDVANLFFTRPDGKLANNVPVTLRAGYAYADKRDELCYDALDRDRNPNYASKNDPIVLQISVVIGQDTKISKMLSTAGAESKAEKLRQQAEELRVQDEELNRQQETLRAEREKIARQLKEMGH